jgi:anti-sigma regulatory factor (Ser/Thr protein kinase)
MAAGTYWEREFSGHVRELPPLRQWLASVLPACPACEDLILVASELAANAIRHTASGRGGRFGVEIIASESAVRISVRDSGAPTGLRPGGDLLAESGRGLLVVGALAERTGVSGDRHGRLVWADIRWPEGAQPSAG